MWLDVAMHMLAQILCSELFELSQSRMSMHGSYIYVSHFEYWHIKANKGPPKQPIFSMVCNSAC